MNGAKRFHVRPFGTALGDSQFIIESIGYARDRRAGRHQQTGGGECTQIFIVEVEMPKSSLGKVEPTAQRRVDSDCGVHLAVGCAIVRHEWLPKYISAQFHIDAIWNGLEGATKFAYLEVPLTDFCSGYWRKGAGSALIQFVQDHCRQMSKKILYVDT
ncbi:hypothetical protein F5Y19DRAFT_481169 [Xylariaceae sp. FL1651]|nr:hypothetical protein F5Y19DRAFT_481169 [Xylariaceae sp. FL1651]